MPRQNRVTPSGELIAVPSRGALMGNRGILHDEHQRIRRTFNGRRWIYCRLEFKDRRQTVMAPGHYTQLFFLDEATALAAGHRPCAECMRGRYREFQAAWAAANPDQAHGADAMDAVLHAERVGPSRQKATYGARLDRLPFGAMVLLPGSDEPCLVRENAPPVVWTPDGYGRPMDVEPGTEVRVLTPRSVVSALAKSLNAAVHPSAGQRSGRAARRLAALGFDPRDLILEEIKAHVRGTPGYNGGGGHP